MKGQTTSFWAYWVGSTNLLVLQLSFTHRKHPIPPSECFWNLSISSMHGKKRPTIGFHGRRVQFQVGPNSRFSWKKVPKLSTLLTSYIVMESRKVIMFGGMKLYPSVQRSHASVIIFFTSLSKIWWSFFITSWSYDILHIICNSISLYCQPNKIMA